MLTFESVEAGSQREKLRQAGHAALHRGKETIVRLVIWMLHLYPPAWRERYEAEMAALLEQHEITLWTVLDLLVGALDSRLDPHYRRSQQVLPLRRLQASWKWLARAFVAFWLSLLLWSGMWDMGLSPNESCAGDSASRAVAYTVGAHNPPLAQAIVGGISFLAFFLLFPLCLHF